MQDANVLIVYQPRCRRAGRVRSWHQLSQWMVEDTTLDLDGFLRAEVLRRLCELDCPLCSMPLGRQMASDHPDDYRLDEQPGLVSYGGLRAAHYVLEELVTPPGRLVLGAG